MAKTDCQFYEQVLNKAIDGWLLTARKVGVTTPDLLVSINFRLTQRKMHWMAEALRVVREDREKGQAAIPNLDINRVLQKAKEALDRAAASRTPTGQPASGSAQDHKTLTDANKTVESERLKATINCPSAARKVEAHLKAKGISQTEFANEVGTTDRTIRSFRKTGKIRRDIFVSIAKAMKLSKEELLRD